MCSFVLVSGFVGQGVGEHTHRPIPGSQTQSQIKLEVSVQQNASSEKNEALVEKQHKHSLFLLVHSGTSSHPCLPPSRVHFPPRSLISEPRTQEPRSARPFRIHIRTEPRSLNGRRPTQSWSIMDFLLSFIQLLRGEAAEALLAHNERQGKSSGMCGVGRMRPTGSKKHCQKK